ncbi:hypothetical protein POTOM_042520 [Populus tomentosa]|uniref:Protein FAR1-RELATED SEQUENCE n=1 Tax=Populus tomentosa TaxID=118781 RepID=A0A8X7YNZ0_POPTO|nr:hypothetical protein POTOM_042520 [Populus tomentosa]
MPHTMPPTLFYKTVVFNGEKSGEKDVFKGNKFKSEWSKVHGLVVSRNFTCSKEGYWWKDKRDLNVKKHQKETRTGCLACKIVTRQLDGEYRVTYFEAEHNHDNIDRNNAESQLLWREIHVDQAAESDLPSNSGTESSSTFELVKRQFEVWKYLDQLAMDFDNSLRSERIRDMKEGEAGRLLCYFKRQHIENPSFIHSIQVDIDDKVSFKITDKGCCDVPTGKVPYAPLSKSSIAAFGSLRKRAYKREFPVDACPYDISELAKVSNDEADGCSTYVWQ